MQRRLLALIATGGAACALLLSGCNAIGDAIGDKVDDAVAGATAEAQEAIAEELLEAGSTVDADIDLGIEGTAELPSSFPSDLPLPDGTLVFSYGDTSSWELLYTITDRAMFDDLVSAFEADGSFTKSESLEAEELVVHTFTSDAYSVSLAFSIDGEEMSLIYGVESIG